MDAFGRARATAFLFPGQGSQHVGMARALCDAFPVAQRTLEEANDVLGFDLARLCFEGPEAELTDTINAQPALLATSIAILRALQAELGLPFAASAAAQLDVESSTPNAMAGHSLGEYSALVAAGSIAYADGLRLVRERGRLMQQAGERSPGMMAAILGLDQAVVAEVCAASVAQMGGMAQVANDNCPGQVVISGDRAGMEAAMAALASAGAKKVVPLAVSIAAHSPLMQSAADGMALVLAETAIETPGCVVYGNTTATPLVSGAAVRGELLAQMTGSVLWTSSMQAMVAAGITTFVEVGAGEVLTGLVKRVDRGAARYAVNTPETLATYLASFGA